MNKVQLFNLTHLVLLTTLRLDAAQSSRCALCFAELYSPNLTIEKTTVIANTPVLWLKPERSVLVCKSPAHLSSNWEERECWRSFPYHHIFQMLPSPLIWKSSYLTCPSPAFESWSFSPNTPHTLCGQEWLQSKALQHPAPGHPTATMARTKGWHRIDLLRVPSNHMGALCVCSIIWTLRR